MSKIRIYYAHLMEGLKIPEESGARGREARILLGDRYDLLLAEDWQDAVKHEDIMEVDLLKLESAKIVIADFYRSGKNKNEEDDNPVLGRGTNQEVAWAKCRNKYLAKKVPIYQILRATKNFHPFDKELYGVKNFHSLEECIAYVKRTHK
jgi:hypothetical protein